MGLGCSSVRHLHDFANVQAWGINCILARRQNIVADFYFFDAGNMVHLDAEIACQERTLEANHGPCFGRVPTNSPGYAAKLATASGSDS